jgi:hypothetical protein
MEFYIELKVNQSVDGSFKMPGIFKSDINIEPHSLFAAVGSNPRRV